MILTKKQEDGLKIATKRFKDKEPYTCIAGFAGTGKAQPVDTIIPTPSGYKTLGEVKIGDYVFDRNGNPTKVLGVFPQGYKKVYTIVFEDGRKTEACAEHNWTVVDHYNKERVLTTLELKTAKFEFFIPSSGPVKYPKKEYDVDPFLMGSLLGNIHSKIPEEYKIGSVEQRFSLIKSLTGINETNKLNFTSTNLELIKDLQEILYSLGYISNISTNSEKRYFTIEAEKYEKLFVTNVKEEPYEKEMVCIYVDNEEHLYLTNDYIVTHNTTLINFIIDSLDLEDYEVCYIAYTGKATQVLREKGCKTVSTAHKLLYKAERLGTSYVFTPRDKIPDFKLIVVDEVSMIPKDMWNLLLSHKIPVIALGDPGQLPPVKEIDSGILQKPHIFLDEVMRQALDNEIIRFSMDAREGKPLPLFSGEQVKIIQKEALPLGVLLWADQVICGKNNTRRAINLAMHKEYVKNDELLPTNGDKVICLHNEWGCLNESQEPLINGMIGYVKNLYWTQERSIKFLTKFPIFDFYPESNSPFYSLRVDPTMFFAGKKADYDNFAKHKIRQFDFGYAITAWKAQGSEWNNVVFVEEYFNKMTKEENKRLLYTAITRAREKLIILR